MAWVSILLSQVFSRGDTGSSLHSFSLKSGSEQEEIEMQREGMFSPLDELFYNKLPAGVRKCEICGFQLTQKLRLECSWEDMLNPTQPFVSAPVFLGKHISLLLHLLPSLVLTQPVLRALPESRSFYPAPKVYHATASSSSPVQRCQAMGRKREAA